jgi:hypothetical protein
MPTTNDNIVAILPRETEHGFLGHLQGDWDPAVRGTVVTLLADLIFVRENGERILVPKGYRTDGASIPPLFRPVVGDALDRRNVRPAAVHDFLEGTAYMSGDGMREYVASLGRKPEDFPQVDPTTGRSRYSTRDADGIFAEALKTEGKPSWKVTGMYAAVRVADVAAKIPLLGRLFKRVIGQGKPK